MLGPKIRVPFSMPGGGAQRMPNFGLASFKKGGTVKKTGAYKLHKGEVVVPAGKAKRLNPTSAAKIRSKANRMLGK